MIADIDGINTFDSSDGYFRTSLRQDNDNPYNARGFSTLDINAQKGNTKIDLRVSMNDYELIEYSKEKVEIIAKGKLNYKKTVNRAITRVYEDIQNIHIIMENGKVSITSTELVPFDLELYVTEFDFS